ncbi:MAG: hypothetical protein WCF67_02705 [Chitinophagaceae bacterium]
MQPTTKYFELTASAFDWQVSEEKTIKAWGFNNSVPGPEYRFTVPDAGTGVISSSCTCELISREGAKEDAQTQRGRDAKRLRLFQLRRPCD